MDDAEVKDRFRQLYTESEWGWRMRWQGMWTLQNPMDVWATAEIIYDTRPQVFVETGTHTGGSAHLWALLLSLNGGELVVTVDVDHKLLQGDQHPSPLPIEWVEGDSVEMARTVSDLLGGRRAMVLLDSDHSTEHVAAELEAYAPLVSEGCYLVCQDTGQGPEPALRTFLAEHPEFKVDHKVEPFFTYCRGGYLVRDATP